MEKISHIPTMSNSSINTKMTLQEVFAIMSLENFVEENVKTRENAGILIDILNDCSCCFRHSIHRPSYLNDYQWEQHLPIQDGAGGWLPSYRKCNCFHLEFSQHDDDTECKCPCRHYSRVLQKAF